MTANHADITSFFQQSNQVKCEPIDLLGVEVTVVREDLNHPVVQGNKLRKLKYNLIAAGEHKANTILTFGGAYSNHLVATAYAAQKLGFDSIGVVRGDELENNQAIWSETLYQCQQYGMQLVFVSRTEYRLKQQAPTVKTLLEQTPGLFVVPEGGSNAAAVKGMAEVLVDLPEELSQTSHLICPVGTGGTLAGLTKGVLDQNWHCKVYGVAVLKGLQSVKSDINQWLGVQESTVDWQILPDFHCGGYAKSTPELESFAIAFKQKHGFSLDKIYNSKSFYALAQLIKNGVITDKDKPVIIHTGGLQGGVF
jgi:1-aminocyclopropane-1-carboxylate deaminase